MKLHKTQFGLLSKQSTALWLLFLGLSLTFLGSFPAIAADQCNRSHSETKEKVLTGSQFLLEKDPSLHMNEIVARMVKKQFQKSGVRLQKPSDKISTWLNQWEQILTKASNSPWALTELKEILYRQFVIKPNEVPEKYFELQMRIQREAGKGNVTFSQAERERMIESLIVDQKRSLDRWIMYFTSSDSLEFPVWMKYWMFSGLVKLSKFNDADGTFSNRDKNTVGPFPELNRQSVLLVKDLILNRLNKESLKNVEDPLLRTLIDGASFGKIYGYILKTAGPKPYEDGKFVTNDGVWVVYKKDQDHMPLVKILEEKNTGWCTANEGTAQLNLSGGDFHVYLSFDQNQKPTIPRIALRFEGPRIAEVRGVLPGQKLDTQIKESSILSTKLKEIGPWGIKYEKASRDMQKLTAIENRHNAGLPLSREDLIFLYELDEPIASIEERDPRISEIRSKRNTKDDLYHAFNGRYSKKEISVTSVEWETNPTKVHYGNLNYSAKDMQSGKKLPEVLIGDLQLSSIESADGLKLPDTLIGTLNMLSVISPHGLHLPKNLKGKLILGIETADGLEFLECGR